MVGEYGLYYDKDKMTRDQEQDEEDEHPDIRHTAPQHSQYLGDRKLICICICISISAIQLITQEIN